MKHFIFQMLVVMTVNNVFSQTDLSHLNDDFSNPNSISNWKSHHQTEGWPGFISKSEISDQSNTWLIEPQSSGWFGEFHRGPYYYKEVSGDFTVITRVKVTGYETQSPTSSYSLAGLMVRAARPIDADKNAKGHENWMFLSTGAATKKDVPQFESKNTAKGKSKLKVFPAKTGWIELAISRKGNQFYQSYRYDGDTAWVLLRVVERNDMPETLQVGILAYSDFWSVARKYFFNRQKFNTVEVNGKPDVKAEFDYVKFIRPLNEEKIEIKVGFPLLEMTKKQKSIIGLM